ncbi:MAG: sigma 54-interacting transcriptional regulator [Blastocatellales bacterium]
MEKELRILILEDIAAHAELMERELRKAGMIFSAKRVATRAAFIAALGDFNPDLILADYSLPSFDGAAALSIAREQRPDAPFVFVSGAIGEELAIETLKQGATDYVLKQRLARLAPAARRALREAEDRCARQQAEAALRKAHDELEVRYEEIASLKARLEQENSYLQEEIRTEHNFEEIVGGSAAVRKALQAVETVAPTGATVLILGETGTGKELIARATHNLSPQKDKPLVKVNCAALASTLIESELFGHEKGAFTGAISRKIGRFELANGGTIFLDEIGDLPLELQSKLLRVLQEGEFERVGSSQTIKVSVRVIAATNRNLAEAVKAGSFRSDLFYRLNVFPLTLPPLRDRREDIPLLVSHFLSRFAKKLGKPLERLSKESMDRLMRYDWPGNVRELLSVIERAAILARGSVVHVEDSLDLRLQPAADTSVLEKLEDLERAHIIRVLEETNWMIDGQRGAALILGLHPNTLRSRMQKLGIKKLSSAVTSIS